MKVLNYMDQIVCLGWFSKLTGLFSEFSHFENQNKVIIRLKVSIEGIMKIVYQTKQEK